MKIDGEHLWAMLDELGAIGHSAGAGGGVTRLACGPADMAGRTWVAERMVELGMTVTRDPAGNTIGTLPGDDRSLPPVAVGSHTDTVKDGGRFDGALGVLAGLACVRAVQHARGRLRHDLEVIDFAAEEATFAGGLFGSRAMAGALAPGAVALPAWGGRRIADHLRDAGVDPERVADARRRPGSLTAYFELHIEQGELLERANAAIGIVEAIVGVRTFGVDLPGRAAHAGSTPMDHRRDALVAAAELVLAVRDAAVAEDAVATVGELAVQPGGSNIVPGHVELSLDVRSIDDGRISAVVDRVEQVAGRLGATLTPRTAVAPTPMSTRLTRIIGDACADRGLPALTLSSGAGHDAMCMAGLTDAAMIFVPSRGGISHAPDEHTDLHLCAAGAQVLLDSVVAVDAAGDSW